MTFKTKMEENNSTEKSIRLLQQVALISAVFAVLICVLIIVNYIQTRRADPLNSKTMMVLIERLKNNPEDDQLRTEIREFDLLARKAFFTNRWQVKTGGLLLFFSVVLIIICLQTIDLMKKKIPEMPVEEKESVWDIRMLKRNWIAGAGITLVTVALLFTVLSHNELAITLEAANLDDPSIVENSSGTGKLNKPANSEAAQLDKNSPGSEVINDSENKAVDDLKGGYPSWNDIKANYASFRGPGGNGIAFQKNIPVNWDGKSGKNILWKIEIPLPGYNSPVIWGDKIFLSGANDTRREVYCIDANSGKIRWNTTVEKITGSPAQAPKVNKETGFSAPTLTTDGRCVYAIFANGDLVALDMEGKKVWDKNLGSPKNHYGHSSSLIMFHDKLIIQYDQTGNACVLALSAKTGKEIWRTTRNVRVSWASPVIVNTGKRIELLLAADPYVASYNPETGKELWKLECISGEVGPSVAFANGVVFSVNEYAKLSAIQIGDNPKILWEDTEYLSDVPSPVATDKYLFLSTSYGTMVCYDAKTGKKNWVTEFGNQIYSSPVLVEGKIYLMDSKGVMHIFKAEKDFSLVGEPHLGEGSFCTPAFQDGRIFIRGDKNLYCVGK
jgi:outer membrane protein assembly factor BamB